MNLKSAYILVGTMKDFLKSVTTPKEVEMVVVV